MVQEKGVHAYVGGCVTQMRGVAQRRGVGGGVGTQERGIWHRWGCGAQERGRGCGSPGCSPERSLSVAPL